MKAEDPYLQVDSNTGLWVERGGVATLTSANLSVLTNLDVRTPGEVTYKVYIPPTHGVLLLTDPKHQEVTTATGGVSTFTQQDLSAGLLVYLHDNSLQLSDGFNMTARVRERGGEEGGGGAGGGGGADGTRGQRGAPGRRGGGEGVPGEPPETPHRADTPSPGGGGGQHSLRRQGPSGGERRGNF